MTDGRVGTVSFETSPRRGGWEIPKAIHEGDGHLVLFVDDKASNEQADAFARVVSGQLGRMPWEAIAGTVVRFDGPIRKPIVRSGGALFF